MATEDKEYTELLVNTNVDQGNTDDNVGNNEFFCDIVMTSLEAEVPEPNYQCINVQTSSVPVFFTSVLSSFDSCDRDVQDSLAQSGIAGLRNLGNTCFMNSGMQCLLSNPCIVKFFLEEFKTDESNRHTLAGKFATLLRKFWSGCFSMLHPADFRQTVGLYHPQFQDYRQHDCQEFLALLLDSLHEHLNAGCSLAKCSSSETDGEESGTGEGVSGGGTMSMKDCLTGLESNDSESGSECCSSNACHSLCPPSKLNVCSPSDRPRKESMTLDCLNQLYGASEDSNLSEPSRASTDSGVSDQSRGVARWAPIPEEIKAESGVSRFFGKGSSGDVELNMPEIVAIEAGGESKCNADGLEIEMDAVVGERKLPSIEDFCNKDTKTLNTNVLATEYLQEAVSTDSKKFLKLDNNSRSSVGMQDEEMNAYDHLNDLLTCDTEKETCKPVKDTNLLANCRDKFSDGGCYVKKLLFSEREPSDEYNINNTKRIKVDEEEKNLRMQSKLKVNTEQNQTKDWDGKTTPGGHLLEDRSYAVPIPSESQLLSFQRTLSTSAMPCLNNEDHLWIKYVRSAEKAWLRYTQQNKSVIVDTFQGQFKSTVICLECHHISVTFEPFMYLSVPLPHALERQISITFIPCDNKQPVRYLITAMRHDSIRKIRQELVHMIGDDSCDIVLAEVFDNHIARILEDNLEVRFINDINRLIYAFEMLPPPRLDEFSTEQSPTSDVMRVGSEGDVLLQNNILSSTARDKMMSARCNSPADVNELLEYFESNDAIQGVCSSPSSLDVVGSCGVESSSENLLNNSYEGTASATSDSRIDTKPEVNWHHNLLQLPAAATEDCQGDVLGTDVWRTHPGIISDVDWGESDDNVHLALSSPRTLKKFGQGDAELQLSKFGEEGTSSAGCMDDTLTSCANAVSTDEWKTCAICLDEMLDSDLLVHASCGGTLCHPCLEMSFKHYGRATYTCPTCSTAVDPAEDFVRLNNMADYKPRTRILSVPVMYRYDGETDEAGREVGKLFGHPNMLYLPNKLTGELLYETVDRVVPCIMNYSIILTDGQGYHCSRCLYTQHCSGCEVSRDSQLNLQPSDHLVVKFTDLNESNIEAAGGFVNHISMENLRSSASLTLNDCFQAFTESEMLDEHNPWFCPKCHKNQCAKKTMTVWRFPDTLVVYLKRFVYHELSSTKIDSKVIFPVENLDLSNYTSGPRNESLTYDLQSCVCHFGGTNSGHYTAYAKHPIKGEWYYFNDETTVKREPQEADYSHAYVLFYQRKGRIVQFHLPQQSGCEGKQLNCEDSTLSHCALNSGILPMAQVAPIEDDARADFGDMESSPDTDKCQSSTSQFDFYS